MKIGVISDTHNYLDPGIPELFAGVEHILHGGDVGTAFILFQLEQIAPVTAVMGNTDTFLDCKQTEVVTLSARKFLIHHIVNPRAPETDLRLQIARERPDVVVFGHTHKRFCETIDGRLFFNPGYAGKQRFALERSVAILHLESNGIRPEFIGL